MTNHSDDNFDDTEPPAFRFDVEFLMGTREATDEDHLKMMRFMRAWGRPSLTAAVLNDILLNEQGVTNVVHLAIFAAPPNDDLNDCPTIVATFAADTARDIGTMLKVAGEAGIKLRDADGFVPINEEELENTSIMFHKGLPFPSVRGENRGDDASDAS
jgi:hypothetical protein